MEFGVASWDEATDQRRQLTLCGPAVEYLWLNFLVCFLAFNM